MKKFGVSVGFLSVIAGFLTSSSLKAADYVLGENFAVSRTTTISELGVFDGGSPFTGDVYVGIFDSTTGNLVGPDVFFGPHSGVQVGKTLTENVTPFNIAAGEYSVVAVGALDPDYTGNSGLDDIYSLQNLGGALNLPGGGRFNSGTVFDIANYTSRQSNPSFDSGTFDIVDPPTVPDGGSTALLLGGALAGLSWMRRKL